MNSNSGRGIGGPVPHFRSLSTKWTRRGQSRLGVGILLILCFSWLIYDGLFLRVSQKPRFSVPKNDVFRLNASTVEKCVAVAASPLTSALNLPTWYRTHDWGLHANKSLETLALTVRGQDKEEETAWNNFFFGTSSGLILEIGALDGSFLSVSYFFEYFANWRSILVEGSPVQASSITRNRPNALAFNAAICDKPREVHYTLGSGGVDGILEFMTPTFLSTFMPTFTTNGKLDPAKVQANMKSDAPLVKKVQCLPLTHVLAPFELKHINFFMLDVEGGELNVLKSIDYNKVEFDVIAVETDRGTDSAEATQKYVDSVIQLLTSKGYILWQRKLGRNSWFVSPTFKPLSKTMIDPNN